MGECQHPFCDDAEAGNVRHRSARAKVALRVAPGSDPEVELEKLMTFPSSRLKMAPLSRKDLSTLRMISRYVLASSLSLMAYPVSPSDAIPS